LVVCVRARKISTCEVREGKELEAFDTF